MKFLAEIITGVFAQSDGSAFKSLQIVCFVKTLKMDSPL